MTIINDKKMRNSFLYIHTLSVLVLTTTLLFDFNQQIVGAALEYGDTIGNDAPANRYLESFSHGFDTLNRDVYHIRQHVESISCNTDTYLKDVHEKSEWNKKTYKTERLLTIIDLLLSSLSIVAVIIIYVLTQRKTQESTNTIKDAVVHMEKRFITERDKARIDAPYSSVIINYEALCKELNNNYSHFTTKSKDSVIYQRASKIKEGIRIISQILSSYSSDYPIPNAKAFVDSIDDVVDNPSFNKKREQIIKMKKEGQQYKDQLKNYIQGIFYTK